MWVLSVSMEASIRIFVLRLVLLVSMVSFLSTVSTRTFMVLVKNLSDTNGKDVAVLLMAWILSNNFSYRSMYYADGGFVGFGIINVSFMWNKFYLLPNNVCRLGEPLRGDPPR